MHTHLWIFIAHLLWADHPLGTTSTVAIDTVRSLSRGTYHGWKEVVAKQITTHTHIRHTMSSCARNKLWDTRLGFSRGKHGQSSLDGKGSLRLGFQESKASNESHLWMLYWEGQSRTAREKDKRKWRTEGEHEQGGVLPSWHRPYTKIELMDEPSGQLCLREPIQEKEQKDMYLLAPSHLLFSLGRAETAQDVRRPEVAQRIGLSIRRAAAAQKVIEDWQNLGDPQKESTRDPLWGSDVSNETWEMSG